MSESICPETHNIFVRWNRYITFKRHVLESHLTYKKLFFFVVRFTYENDDDMKKLPKGTFFYLNSLVMEMSLGSHQKQKLEHV